MRNGALCRVFAALLMACPALAAATTEPAAALSSEDIREAIAAASNKKQPGCYLLEPKASIGTKLGETVGCVSTPYTRVVAAAREATAKYKTFSEADVTPDILGEPGQVQVVGVARSHGSGVVSSVISIVVLPRGVKDPSRAIHPSSTSDVPEVFKNLMGASFDGKGMLAVFPTTALHGTEIHVVYDGHGLCTDCKVNVHDLVSKGMTSAEVRSLLGVPSEIRGDATTGEHVYGPVTLIMKAGRVDQVKKK